ncbi:MAG: hypothetical protein KatS3mg083_318 [Candidatus Dojkabacteria bacterium]|nr:MAG: hypothetical protein KatS3mg083_318 [Candidatus Dojkabacteria bacterium]
MEVVKNIIDWILEIIAKYGLLGVFIGSALEEIIAPIPSPLVMMSSGAALLGQYNDISVGLVTNMFLIAIVGSFGATLGSYVIYTLGYVGGKPVIDKTKKLTGVSWDDIQNFQSKLDGTKKDELTIMFLRAIPVMPSVVIAVSCGVLRVNPFSYFVSFFCGGVVRNVCFLVIGWQMGSAYLQGADSIESMTSIVSKVIAGILVVLLGYLYWRRYKIEKGREVHGD